MLERILLNADGQPRVRFSEDGLVIPQGQSTTRYGKSNDERSDRQSSTSDCISANIPDILQQPESMVRDQVDDMYVDPNLPTSKILLDLIDCFCQSFHHWIPFLHKAHWKRQIETSTFKQEDIIILHAVIAVTLPHIRHEDLPLRSQLGTQKIHSRNLVLETAMTQMTLQTTQALLILVFNDVSITIAVYLFIS